MNRTAKFPIQRTQLSKSHRSTRWPRTIVLGVLGYEGAGCLLGGSLLVVEPDGRLMKMPVEIMHGSFPSFLVPGIILIALGLLTGAAFISVLRRRRNDWQLAGLALVALLGWFWIEIAILQTVHWLHAMWGLPVLLGALMVVPLIPGWRRAVVSAALACGIISSVLFFVINIIVPLHYPGYSFASRVPSELSAIGAPTRTLWSVLVTPYTFLMFAFGWGVWKTARSNRRLRIAGAALLAYAALGFLWPFAAMHQREVLAAGGGSMSDTLHIVLGGATQAFYLVALGFAGTALGKGFRVFSVISFIVLLFFGTLTFIDAPKLSANEPTPLIGVWERIDIAVFLIWIVVLAVLLLRLNKRSVTPGLKEPERNKKSTAFRFSNSFIQGSGKKFK